MTTNVAKVFAAIYMATEPLTSYQIKALTGLTTKQVSQATSALRLRGKIQPEREIDVKTKPFNRYRDEPQRWRIIEKNESNN